MPSMSNMHVETGGRSINQQTHIAGIDPGRWYTEGIFVEMKNYYLVTVDHYSDLFKLDKLRRNTHIMRLFITTSS